MDVLKLSANPTFVATVAVPTTDGEVKIKVTFKYMDGDAWKAFVDERVLGPDKKGTDEPLSSILADLIVGWKGVEAPYSPEVLKDLERVHKASMSALWRGYIDALSEGKLGN